eukprot:6196001-Pleurochrysis_carterae.AAC.1
MTRGNLEHLRQTGRDGASSRRSGTHGRCGRAERRSRKGGLGSYRIERLFSWPVLGRGRGKHMVEYMAEQGGRGVSGEPVASRARDALHRVHVSAYTRPRSC